MYTLPSGINFQSSFSYRSSLSSIQKSQRSDHGNEKLIINCVPILKLNHCVPILKLNHQFEFLGHDVIRKIKRDTSGRHQQNI